MAKRVYAVKEIKKLMGRTADASAPTAMGGTAVLTTHPHRHDGPEHTALLPIERLSTAETSTALVAAPDGTGGVAFRAEVGGGSQVFTVRASGSDDTAAINAATAAAMAAGGGVVYTPDRLYRIDGALLNTSTHNSQLIIPQNAAGGSNPPVFIEFRGGGPVSQSNWGTSHSWVVPSMSGTIWLSNWAGTITNHPAVIAASKWDAQYPAASFNWIGVTFRDIEIRTPANPKLSGIQMAGTASLSLYGVTVSTDVVSTASMALPSNSNATGITGPLVINANEPYFFDQVFADGFYTGILVSEVLHGGDVAVHHCVVGMDMGGGDTQFHASHFERVLMVAVKTCIKVTAASYFDIEQLDVEHQVASGTFQRVYDIDDGSNLGHGFITHHMVEWAVGVDDDCSMNGGANLHLRSLSTGTWGGPPGGPAGGDLSGTYPNPSVVDDSHAHTASTLPALSGATPLVESGAGAAGSGTLASKDDHIHPAAASSGAAHYLVISSIHSTPLVFDDIVKSIAGDDFSYTS